MNGANFNIFTFTVPTVQLMYNATYWYFYRYQHYHKGQYTPPPPPSVAIMRRWTWSSLVQVMACRLFAKLLAEPRLLAYRQLDSQE